MSSLLALLLAVCLTGVVHAQEILRGPELEIRCTAATRDAGIAVLNAFGEARGRVQAALGLGTQVPVTVELVADKDALRNRLRALGAGSEPDQWAAAVALPDRGLMLVRVDQASGLWQRLHGLLAHEYAHLALGATLHAVEAPPLPRWVDEGLAQITEGRVLTEATPSLHMRAFFHTLLPLQTLETEFPESEGVAGLAYAEAESFMKWLSRNCAGGIHALVRNLAAGASFATAVRQQSGMTLEAAEENWANELREDRSWMLETLLQIAFGAFVLIACVLAVSRVVRSRQRLRAAMEAEEAASAEPALNGMAPTDSDSGASENVDEELPKAAQSLRRHRTRFFGMRRQRPDEPDPPV